MKRYLITGGMGFIGSHLYENLKKDKSIEVNLTGTITGKIDIAPKFDVIFHLAASTDTRWTPDIEMYRNNINTFLSVLELALEGKSTIVWASSSQIYGTGGKPVTAYGHSKLLCEELAKRYFDKIKIVGLRLYNVFGPSEAPKGKMASMITQWALQLSSEKRPIAFKEERNTRRDHIYVKDVVRAMKQAGNLSSGFYDVGSGKPHTFDEILALVQKYVGVSRSPVYVSNPFKGRYQRDTKADLSWGFRPAYSLEEGIKDYLEDAPFLRVRK